MPSTARARAPSGRGLPRPTGAAPLALGVLCLASPGPLAARIPLPPAPLREVLHPPASPSIRAELGAAGRDLARLGLSAELERLAAVLTRLGEPTDELSRRRKTWDRELARARGRRDPRALRSLATELTSISRALAFELDADHRGAGARLILAGAAVELDGRNARAGRELGRVEHDGEWLTPVELEARAGATRLERLVAESRQVAPPIEWRPSDLQASTNLALEDCLVARAAGVEVHGTLTSERLERVLVQALQGAALSRALLGGALEVPAQVRGQVFLLVDSRARYRVALDEALAAGGIDGETHAFQLALRQGSFYDRRGWWTLDAVADPDLAALVLLQLMHEWVRFDAQPCLVAGHLNWICNRLYGVPMPPTLRSAEGTRARAADPTRLWFAARRGTSAARLWLLAQLAEGERTLFERCLQDQLGEVRGGLLARATLEVERLQVLGRLSAVLEATAGRQDRVAAFEEALGRSLPDLDRDFERWLADRRGGLAQRLEAEARRLEAERTGRRGARDPAGEFLSALQGLRAEAIGASSWTLRLEPELSAAAALHARYLALNPDLHSTWQALHVQRPDRPGYDARGARAGVNSVILPASTPRAALEAWMGTCLHRIPLLEPGLFGIGLGQAEGVVVLDVATLVAEPGGELWVPWPPPGAERVPLRMVPEIPSPLPGVEQAGLGFPITLQVRGDDLGRPLEVRLALHRGDPDGPAVEVLAVEPRANHPAPIPADTWCVIPTRPLEPRTRYSVRVESEGGEVPGWLRAWSYQTAGR